MPHIPVTEQVELSNGVKAKTAGQWTYLFARYALHTYNANPKWTTVHEIRKALRSPYHNEHTHKIILMNEAGSTFTRADVETSADLAFFEFYRLVVAKHEDVKILENGNALAPANLPEFHPIVECAVECFEGLLAVPVAKRGRGRPKKVVTSVVS